MVSALQIASLCNPRLAAGLVLLVGKLMRELGETEVTFDPKEYVARFGKSGNLAVEFEGDTLVVKLTEGKETN